MRSTPNGRVKSFMFVVSHQWSREVGTTRELFLRESLAWRGRKRQHFARSAQVHACWAGSLRSPSRVGAPWKRPLPGQKSFRQT